MGAKERKMAAAEAAAAKIEKVQTEKKKAEEDEYWSSQGEGAKSKAQAKREEEERKRQEANKRRLETKRLADEELEKAAQEAKSKTPTKWNYADGARKVTAFELNQHRQAEEEAKAEAVKRAELARNFVPEDQYAKMVDVENQNRALNEEGHARGLDEALAVLNVEGGGGIPSMSYAQFLDRELQLVKADKPGLKMTQYRDIVFKMWERAVENPRSQAHKALVDGMKRAQSLGGAGSGS